jgi:hypothetical protein
LALLIAHERECVDCREERESATSLVADLPLTPSRALLRSLGKAVVAGHDGTTRVSAWLTRGRAWLSTSVTSAALASTRTIESFRLGRTWLIRSARPLARMPEATVFATARLVSPLVRLRVLSTIRMQATARATILLVRGLLTALAHLWRTAAAKVIVVTGHASGCCVGLLARARSFLTPETGFLLRVCAGIAGLGIVAMTLIFVWPRQGPDHQSPDKTITRPSGRVSATPPRAETETPKAVSAPPSVEKQEMKKTARPPAAGLQPESAAPALGTTPAIAREHAASDGPDPSAAIDWLLKGVGGTSRRDIDRQRE